MKVLFCGVYRDGTGWGQAAIDYILSLDAAGVDVVPRPIKLNAHQHEPPARILELEQRPSQGCNTVIQHILPHLMDYNGRLHNIGLYATETSSFRDCAWAERINNLDEAWVINEQMAQSSQDSGVTVPIAVIPHATDVARFQRSYKPLEALRTHHEQGSFIFYTVGEMVRRKNLAALVKAFHLEFRPHEPVELVIKTSISGKSAEEARGDVEKFCRGMKDGLKLYRTAEEYKAETILTERYTDEAISRLHNSCDCFVQPSYGEAWSIPAFDAMGFGKTPILTNWGGSRGYMTEETGWLVPYRLEPVFGVTESFADLYTGNEYWASVDIGALRFAMRQAFEDRDVRKKKSAAGIKRAFDFSHEKVGQLMKEVLDNGPSSQASSQTSS